MNNWLKEIIDWSEVWSLLIPIGVLLWVKKIPAVAKPMAVYVCIALLLNFLQDYFWKKRLVFSFSSTPGDNIIFYNIHSIARFTLFSWFFINIRQPFLHSLKKVLLVAFILISQVNFIFFERITSFSSRILGLEAGGILFYCLLYYVNLLMQEDTLVDKKDAAFWLVTGIGIYTVVSFPLFLFYSTLSVKFQDFAIGIWDLHNVAYCLLCIFIARYFYVVSH
jgi:hypothetical protein